MTRLRLFSICLLCLSLFSNLYSEDEKPKLTAEEINGKKYSYYFKYEMYKDRIALVLKDYKVVVLSPENGTVSSISHTHSKYFKIKSIDVGKTKVEFKADIYKGFWLGEGELKVKSEGAANVGDIKLVYQFKKSSITFHSEILCKVRYSMHPHFYVATYKIENEETDYNVFLKKHYKKSITKLTPYSGKEVLIMLDDDNTRYSKKVKASKVEGGYKKAAVYNRRGYKSMEITPIDSKNRIGLYVTSHFLGADNHRFHVSSRSGGGYESYKYKYKKFTRSNSVLKVSNKTHYCGGQLTFK